MESDRRHGYHASLVSVSLEGEYIKCTLLACGGDYKVSHKDFKTLVFLFRLGVN